MSRKTLDDFVNSRREAVPLSKIRLDSENIRDRYSKQSIIELAHSLSTSGQLQPAVLEKKSENYQIVAGHRRYLASLYAYDKHWTNRNYLLGKIVEPLPEDLRLNIQSDENEYKKEIPSENLAHVLWQRYKISLRERVSDPDLQELIYSAETFEDIPRDAQGLLSISQYAHDISLSPDSVSRAFRYQSLHKDIQRQVSSKDNPLSYSAAVELAKISDKNEQRHVLKVIKGTSSSLSKKVIKDKVNQHLAEKSHFEEDGAFSLIPPNISFRKTALPIYLKEASSALSQAQREISIYEIVRDIMPEFDDLEMHLNGHSITPRSLFLENSEALLSAHEKLLDEENYASRWGHKPKRQTTIFDVLPTLDDESNSKEDLIVSRVVPINKIKENPLNPRGEKKNFDSEELRSLAYSIYERGLIHDPLVMENGSDSYINLEGHRRHAALELLAKEKSMTEVPVLVTPKISEVDQVKLMCDSDLFEKISTDARSRAIARQFKLELKSSKVSTVQDFIHNHPEWGPKKIKNSILYESLPEEIKDFTSQELLSYGVALSLGTLNDPSTQLSLAITSMISNYSMSQVNSHLKRLKNSNPTLFSLDDIRETEKKSEMRYLGIRLEETLVGTHNRLEKIVNKRSKKEALLSSPRVVQKLQEYIKNYQGLREELN